MAAAGFEPNIPIERASSVTNEVWMTPDAVLRINTQGDQRLRREALVAAVLPEGIGYPHLIAYGGDLSSDWLVIERVPGRPLSRCWPAMTKTRPARRGRTARRPAPPAARDPCTRPPAPPGPTPSAPAGTDGDRMRSPR